MKKKVSNKADIIRFWDGDKRLETLYESIDAVIYERGKDLPIPAILGILRLIEHGLIRQQLSEQ